MITVACPCPQTVRAYTIHRIPGQTPISPEHAGALTRTLGEKVILTANEVEHTRHAAQCGAEHILYVLSQITVTDGDTITCSGGTPTRLQPWTIDDNDLIATVYAYTVPR